MRSAVVAGHVCVDLVPELPGVPGNAPGELLEVGPLRMSAGGCVSNTAGDLAELGADVSAVGDVGDDELGSTFVRMLAGRGTRTDGIRRLAGHSTSYSVVVQPPGHDRSFWHHVGANAGFDGSAVEVAGADVLHVGYPSLLPGLTAAGGAALEALLKRARRAGATTSLDLAVLDPASAAARLDWGALLGRVLPLVDVISPSIDDVRTALGGGDGPADAARRLVGMGAGVALVTAGPAGLHVAGASQDRLAGAGSLLAGRAAAWAGFEAFAPAHEVRVCTTLGAGDAATAGLLAGMLAGEEPQACLERAAATAAARVAGAPLPRAA
jgi:sugar/nucleoside kinase (ribokinase family)